MRSRRWLAAVACAGMLMRGAASAGAQFVVSSIGDTGPGSLREAIASADAAGAPAVIVVTATGTLSLTDALPPITNPYGVSITGSFDAAGAPRFTIDGRGYRVFFVYATDPATQTARANVSISNLRITDGLAIGGAGGGGAFPGGGGAGLGGGLLVLQGNVSLTNVSFSNNSAVGGDGGAFLDVFGAGGGGGLGGTGGIGAHSNQPAAVYDKPGGGGGIRGEVHDTAATGGPGGFVVATPGALAGFPGGGASSDGNPGALDAGGGGGTGPGPYGAGGGGLGGGNAHGANGGTGGLGGGGGGATFDAGPGGFAGGGGGAPFGAGKGGFGGGGGGDGFSNGGTMGTGGAGFGGGFGNYHGAGGGLGAGGAVFVRAGNTLTLQDVTFSANTVAGGNPTPNTQAASGIGIGQAMFLGSDVSYTVTAGKIITVADSLGGGDDPEARGGLTVRGTGTLVLSANNTYRGDTSVLGGTLRVSGSIASSGGVTVRAGAVFDAAASQRVASLTVNGGAKAIVSAGVLTVGNNAQAQPLSLAGGGSGRVDVSYHALVLDHSPGNDAAALAYARSLIVQGYDGGDWAGGGITSGSAAADPRTALGYAPATAVLPFANGSATDSFLGTAVDRSAILIRRTLAGDTNLDGKVDFTDLLRLAQSYGQHETQSPEGPWTHGDFTYDGTVDFSDLLKLAQNYGQQLPANDVSAVPEPFGLALLLPALWGARGRRGAGRSRGN